MDPPSYMLGRRKLLQTVDNQVGPLNNALKVVKLTTSVRQQWTFNSQSQLVASGYNQDCLSATTLHVEPCNNPANPDQQWSFDHQSGLVQSGSSQCLSALPPSFPDDGINHTMAILGLRLGGSLSSDPSSPPGVVQAYNSNW